MRTVSPRLLSRDEWQAYKAQRWGIFEFVHQWWIEKVESESPKFFEKEILIPGRDPGDETDYQETHATIQSN